jgi:hypothetical protein
MADSSTMSGMTTASDNSCDQDGFGKELWIELLSTIEVKVEGEGKVAPGPTGRHHTNPSR